jgi:hypothetical protein
MENSDIMGKNSDKIKDEKVHFEKHPEDLKNK